MASHFQVFQQQQNPSSGGISNSHLNLYTRLDVDRSNLLDNFRGAVEVDHPLVDPHLKLVPGLGPLTTRGLTGGDAEHLGGHAHRSLNLKVLILGSPDKVSTHLLQGLHVPGGEGDPDPVHWSLLLNTLAILISRHVWSS